MAIRNHYKEYKNIFDKYNLKIDGLDNFLKKVKLFEIISKTTFYLTILITAMLIYAAFNTKVDQLGIVFMIIIVFVPGLILSLIFKNIKINRIAKLDDFIFNKFLIKKIKVFYSIDELKNYSYDKMEHLSTKVLAEVNLNQATIDLAFMAFEKGAEGIIIVSNNIGTVVTAAIHNKNTSTPIRTTFNYCEALLIKNIKRVELEKSNFDLNYWFDLKEKGAITSEKKKKKKNDLLLK